MTDKAKDDLRVLVDKLGPNMWLVMDEVAIERYFGYGEKGLAAAVAFAAEAGCALIRDRASIRLGRADYV